MARVQDVLQTAGWRRVILLARAASGGKSEGGQQRHARRPPPVIRRFRVVNASIKPPLRAAPREADAYAALGAIRTQWETPGE